MSRKSRLRERPKTTERVPAVQLSPDVPPPRGRKALLVACAVLTTTILLVFARVASQDFVNFDDPGHVTGNSVVKRGLTADGIRWAFTAFHASSWHPLPWLTHMIDVQLFGLDAGAHKLVNVAFHAGVAILLLLFLVRATGAVWLSLAVAALFALHPTRVESVAWVSGRKDVLGALLFMLALFLYAGYVRSGRASRLIGVTAAFALALMAAPSVIALPFVLLLLDWWPFRRFDRARMPRLLLEKLPLFALLIPSIVLTLRAQMPAAAQPPIAARLANAIVSYADSLRLLVWPSGLTILYPFRRNIPAATIFIATALLIAITIAAVRYARRAPFFIAGWLWFLVTLVPMPLQAGAASMADRYTYIPFAGLFIAIVWGVRTFVADRPELARALPAVAAAILTLLSIATFVQAGYWKDNETLYSRAVAVTPDNETAQLNLGAALLDDDKPQEALEHVRAAVSLDPSNAFAQNNLGRALAALGDPAGAERALRQAIALNPKLAEAYRNLADVKIHEGRQEEAVALLAQAKGMKEEDAATRAELAAVRGDVDAALVEYAAAIRESPDDAQIRNGYASMLARKGRDAEALEQYRQALRLRPDHYDATMNAGALLSRVGRDPEAAEHFRRAVAARPNSPEPHIYLALIYGNRGDAARAVEEVEAAASLDQAGANRLFTNAVHIPFKETNLADYRAALKRQQR